MPYKNNSELPDAIKAALPAAAQDIFRSVVNSVLGKGEAEESAFKQGWGAVARAGYSKSEDGKWMKANEALATCNDFGLITWNNEQEVKGFLFQNREVTEDVQEIPVAPLGKFYHPRYGEIEITEDKCKEAVDYFNMPETSKEIQANFEHNSDRNAGWLKKLIFKTGKGLFGIVKRGKQLIDEHKNGNYRFISPEIFFNTINKFTGKPLSMRVSGVAFTNKPFFENMAPVVPFDDSQTQTWFFTDEAEDGDKFQPVQKEGEHKSDNSNQDKSFNDDSATLKGRVAMEKLLKLLNGAGYRFSEGAGADELFAKFREMAEEVNRMESELQNRDNKISGLEEVIEQDKAKFAEIEAENKKREEANFAEKKANLFKELISDRKLTQAQQDKWEATLSKNPEMFNEYAEILRSYPAAKSEPEGTKADPQPKGEDKAKKFYELVDKKVEELKASGQKFNDEFELREKAESIVAVENKELADF